MQLGALGNLEPHFLLGGVPKLLGPKKGFVDERSLVFRPHLRKELCGDEGSDQQRRQFG